MPECLECVDKPPPEGKTVICVASRAISHNAGHAFDLAKMIQEAYPSEYETRYYVFKSEPQYKEEFCPKAVKFAGHQSDHKTSPFCWLETTSGKVPKAGRDRICEWAAETFVGDDATKKKIVAFANTMPKKPPSSFVAFHCPKPGITGTLP